MNEVEQQTLNNMFGHRINFSVQNVKVDHPVLKFVHDQMIEHMINSIKNAKHVLLIGTTLKELMHFSHRCPSVHFSGVIGLLDLKDDARIVDGMIKAKRHLSNPTTSPHVRDVAQSFYDTVTTGTPSQRFCMHTHQWQDNRTFDIALCVDSLYDMDQEVMLEYGSKFRIQKFLSCMLSAPEMLYVDETINGIYGVEFRRLTNMFEKQIAMRYLSSIANGYIHNEKTFLNWHKHIIFQNSQVAYLMEAQHTYEAYHFISFSRVTAGKYKTIVTPWRFSSAYRRIFDAQIHIRNGDLHYYFVDRAKYNECLLYAVRLSVGAFEPTKILSYMAAKLHRVIIGGQEFAKSWKISQREVEKTCFFIIMHAALLRGELFEFNSDVVARSKKGGKRDSWIARKWHKFIDWLCNVKKEKLLTAIEEADTKVCREYNVHYTSVKSSDGNPTAQLIPLPPPIPGSGNDLDPSAPRPEPKVSWVCEVCEGVLGHTTTCTKLGHIAEIREVPFMRQEKYKALKLVKSLELDIEKARKKLRRAERHAATDPTTVIARQASIEALEKSHRLSKMDVERIDREIADYVRTRVDHAKVITKPIPTALMPKLNHVVPKFVEFDKDMILQQHEYEKLNPDELAAKLMQLRAAAEAMTIDNDESDDEDEAVPAAETAVDEGGPVAATPLADEAASEVTSVSTTNGTNTPSTDADTPTLTRHANNVAEQLDAAAQRLQALVVTELPIVPKVETDDEPVVHKGKERVEDPLPVAEETTVDSCDEPIVSHKPSWASEASDNQSELDRKHEATVQERKTKAQRMQENNNNARPSIMEKRARAQPVRPTKPKITDRDENGKLKIVDQINETSMAELKCDLLQLCDEVGEEENRIFADGELVNALMKAGRKPKKYGNQAGAKAEQIVEHCKLDLKDAKIVDICAGPGAASRYFLSQSNHVTSITRKSQKQSENFYDDLKSNKRYLDIIKDWNPLKAEWGNGEYDFAYCDGAEPCEGGARAKEAANVQLLQRQLMYGFWQLKVGGTLVCKVIGGELDVTRNAINTYAQMFEQVQMCTPNNTKLSNSEWYVVFVGKHRNPKKCPGYLRAFDDKFENKQLMEGIMARYKAQLDALKAIQKTMKAAAEPQTFKRDDRIDDRGFFKSRTAPPGWVGPYPEETDEIDESDPTKLGKYYFNMKEEALKLRKKWGTKFSIPDDQCRQLLKTCINDYKLKQNAGENEFYALHKTIVDKRENTIPLPTYQNIKVRIKDMVAGAGKTYSIAQEFDVERDLYVTSLGIGRQEFKLDVEKRLGKEVKIPFAFTIDAFLQHDKLSSARKIFVDEYTTFPIHWLILVFTLAPNAEYTLVGNIDQCGFMDQYAFLGPNAGITHWTEQLPAPTFCTETRRFGPTVSSFLRRNMAYKIKTHSCADCGIKHPIVPNTRITKSDYHDRLIAVNKNIAFSSKCIGAIGAKRKFNDNSTGWVCNTVRETQGSSVDTANLFLSTLQGDLNHYRTRDLAIVAFSRTKNHLNLVEWDHKAIEATGYNIMAAPLNDEIATGIPFVPMPEKFVKERETIEHPIPERALEFDARALEESLPHAHAELRVHQNAFVFDAPAGPATATSFPLEKRAQNDAAVLTLNAYGKKYRHNAHQTLWTGLSRLANKNAPTIKVGQEYTFNLAKKFRKKFLKEKIEFPQFFHEKAEQVIRVFQKYKEQHKLPEIDITDVSVHGIIRLFIKAQTKIKHDIDSEAKDPAKLNSALGNKPGQPILAWAKALNAQFAAFFSTLEKVFIHNLKDEYVYANGKSDEELEEALNELPRWRAALCADVSEYDSRQNMRTQNLEYAILQCLIPNDCLAEYYQFRKGMKVVSDVLNYTQVGKKSSGEPATLFANCILLFPYMYLVCPDAVAMVVKGDDSICFFDKVGNEIKVQVSRGKELLECDLKAFVTTVPEFCGYIYGHGAWCYNLRTWSRKILDRHYSVDPRVARKELAEMQLATRDKLRGVGEQHSMKYKSVVSSHAEHMKVPEKTVEFWIDQLRGFCDYPFERFWRDKLVISTDVANSA